MNSKKGAQSAVGAVILLAAIAAFLIMFVVLLPPQERAELLGENKTSTSTTDDTDLEDKVVEENLLTTSPGRIDYLAQKEMEHPLPVINIYTRTESKVLAEKNVAYAKKGVFSEGTASFRFAVPDLANTKNLLLSFDLVSATGKLIITLNEDQVFNAEIEAGNVPPITLPVNLLKDNNELIFAVSSPGLAFWSTNEVSLERIKIVADVTSIDAQYSKNVFLVSETEKRNLEKVVLKFQPGCNYAEVGRLRITVNSNELYNAIPDCNIDMVPIEFSPGLIHIGENEIIFSTEKGSYILSHVIVRSELKEVDFPTYYFELSNEQYEQVMDGKVRVRFTIDFVDVITTKSGDLMFNGHLLQFDTKEVSETFDLSEDIVKGMNALKIKPKKTLDVRELRVDLVD